MRRRICFVTGTRAEFGLMRSALLAIRADRRLQLQIVATGMHVDRSRGQSLHAISAQGWKIDAIVPWQRTRAPATLAIATGNAIAQTASVLEKLKSDIVLVVGDRVEAFAAAAAGAIGGRAVAHVHGGDRALGQVDDSLRHAITKLAHIHFPATAQSAKRLLRLGEDQWRIHCVGSPGVDAILKDAAALDPDWKLTPRRYALLVLHPMDADEAIESRRAQAVLSAILNAGIERVVIIYPNNDPGSDGIVRIWKQARCDDRCIVRANVPRNMFLGLLRDAAMLVGNSSAGIIEAPSFKTPVIDIGPRQSGRERCPDVVTVGYEDRLISLAVKSIWRNGAPRRATSSNPYSPTGAAGEAIAQILSRIELNSALRRKLIAY